MSDMSPHVQTDEKSVPSMHSQPGTAINDEVWKSVPGYVGLYEVSDLGRVRRCARKVSVLNRWGRYHDRHYGEKVLSPILDKSQHPYLRYRVNLCGAAVGISQKQAFVSRLVAEAFIGECPRGKVVAHNDGNALNNRLDNLRYATQLENVQDKNLHGTMLRGEDSPNAVLTDEGVLNIRDMWDRGDSPEKIGYFFGISASHARRIGLRLARVAQ